ncbi:Excreted virulence factor EspC, type VII ESX diderm [Mycolicibacterium rutilum]|uniref:Excreted virulence factor EspC, type VII ESX diderm n=1 Tax=Mycolicibacterium rutilum TaxID=370526 RepID=A0A1H6M5J0_MYCRU|nr:type VII secretion target [Mycolicibacterium rutilum]SEH92613.1 Excreted virulence factor EspC, type VII ESX diderm [Mycolicibacterium rutilum]
MGGTDAARVDVTALASVATQYQTAADIVAAAARTHLAALSFDGAAAGQAYVAHGDAVRRAVEEVADQLWRWSRAASEIAGALRASADRYAEADLRAVGRMG